MTDPSISDIRKNPFLEPFLWHKKTRPNVLNKRLDGRLLIWFFFFWKKWFYAFLGTKNGCYARAFFCFRLGG